MESPKLEWTDGEERRQSKHESSGWKKNMKLCLGYAFQVQLIH